jgi:predicted cobalt transporter CbtA
MMRAFLVRGMLVGLVAGLLSFGFARIFGEPQVNGAIAFERQHEHATGHERAGASLAAQRTAIPAEPELVSRATQANLGLFVGVMVYSAAFGGLFALVFAFFHGRVNTRDPRVLAALLALAGFMTIVLVPQLKYPANPPAVGNHDTISYRTGLFFLMLVISLVGAGLAMRVRRVLLARHGGWIASLAGAGSFLILIGAAMLLLPGVDEVPDAFPTTLLWRFRLASLGTQLVMWTTIGLLFGAMTQRSLATRRS